MSASDDWTVTALGIRDGIGKWQQGENFIFPVAVFGAAAGTFIQANGGTAPIFTTNTGGYQIDKDGSVRFSVRMANDGGTDGVGAVLTRVTIPYIATDAIAASGVMIGYGRNLDATNGDGHAMAETAVGENYYHIFLEAALGYANNGDYTNGGRVINMQLEYKIEP